MKITRNDDEGGAILNCAVRYCLGRQSYMPGLVMDALRPMLPDCSDRTLWCFERDISEWLRTISRPEDGRLTATIDPYHADWEKFLVDVQTELKRRESKTQQ